MSASSIRVQKMLQTYGRHLTSAKRLARFRQALLGEKKNHKAQDARRKEWVQKIATEIIENIIVKGSQNPLILEIMDALEKQFDAKIMLEYSLNTEEIIILKTTNENSVELQGQERQEVMQSLWELTLAKVDATML